MKVVKNQCFGGYSLSPLGLKRLAELQGKECFFFELAFRTNQYKTITLKEAEEKGIFWTAYSVPNPAEYRISEMDEDGTYAGANKRAEQIKIDDCDEDRSNPNLVKVVEELGEKANGRYADLIVVEIPDGIEYEIDEYDGQETIREKHRSW